MEHMVRLLSLHTTRPTALQHCRPPPTPTNFCSQIPSGHIGSPWHSSQSKQWRQPFAPWDRCSPHWDTLTPDCNVLDTWTSTCTTIYNHTTNLTHCQPGSNPFHYKSSDSPSLNVSKAPWLNHMPSAKCLF